MWQSHFVGPSARIDSRQLSEERDGDSVDRDADNFESAYDPRHSTTIQGPEIGDIDSLEAHSDDSFFDFNELGHAEVQEKMIGNI